jgi:hypothetical protein
MVVTTVVLMVGWMVGQTVEKMAELKVNYLVRMMVVMKDVTMVGKLVEKMEIWLVEQMEHKLVV